MTLLMLATVALPLLLTALVLLPWRGRGVLALLPLAPLPALALALLFSDAELSLPGLLLGGAWMLDEVRRVFLLLTALVWLAAGIHAAGYMTGPRLRAFCVFWLLTLSGNLGLILAADIPGFYSFFALMTFAAYGLVIHNGTDEARRAGRIYLIMALLGEVMLLAGLLLGARQADSLMLADLPAAIAGAGLPVALLWLGFGVKASLPLLHFWLPLAHPVAPTPASAVLSGAMIKAGLLGWLLTLPLGEPAASGWADVLIGAGAVGALGAGLIGVCQHNPKTVLAYSSISQMGLMTLLVGAALAEPVLAAALVPVVALYALHHGLAKGALFLAVAVQWPVSRWARARLWLLVALPGLALAGLPFTSGAAAKLAAKRALEDVPTSGLLVWLYPLMAMGAVATTVLVLRFIYCLALTRKTGATPLSVSMGWLVAVVASLLLFWWLPWPGELSGGFLPAGKAIWPLVWPVLAGLALAGLVLVAGLRAPPMPPGDGVVWLEWMTAGLYGRAKAIVRGIRRGWPGGLSLTRFTHLQLLSHKLEQAVRREAGAVFLVVLVASLLLFQG